EKSYPGDPPEVLVSGRSSEKRVRFVQVPVSMLDKISSIEVTPGWETPTLPGKDASDSPSNVLPSGGAVIRNSAYVPK
ncbi:MAG TPA: hypothetical protein VFM18_20180, partial [Methanosarcina sp.]|nr:hypothetical protein [Methanosarcina sp.]